MWHKHTRKMCSYCMTIYISCWPPLNIQYFSDSAKAIMVLKTNDLHSIHCCLLSSSSKCSSYYPMSFWSGILFSLWLAFGLSVCYCFAFHICNKTLWTTKRWLYSPTLPPTLLSTLPSSELKYQLLHTASISAFNDPTTNAHETMWGPRLVRWCPHSMGIRRWNKQSTRI